MGKRQGLLLLFALVVLGALLPLANASAAKDNQGRIVFSSNRDSSDGSTYDLYAIDPDGSHVTRLTNDNGFDFDAAWSPDSKTIAYDSTNTSDGHIHVFVMNADGTHVTQLTFGGTDDFYPAWSQNGHELSFTSQVATGHEEMFVMNADGTNVRQVTHTSGTEFNHHSSWLDNDKIVYGHAPDNTGGGPYTILTINKNGKDAGSLTPPDMTNVDEPSVTHAGGHRIVFVDNFCGPCNPSDIFTMDATGKKVQQLTSNFSNNLDPHWSPDGRSIAFTHDDDNPPQFTHEDIFRMSDDGSHVFNVTQANGASDNVEPTWGCPGDPGGGSCHS